MLQQFFDKLDDRLDSARKVEERLGKEVAHNFNVLNYLDTKEIGISHIIGDLLDPNGCHGQGSFFLKMLLEKLDIIPREFGLNLEDARVFRERRIENGRFIDIYIDIPSIDRASYCLAFENKPKAGDKKDQVRDYLNYLSNEYQNNRFWLIYLSPRGEPPSAYSLPRVEINNRQWEDCLIVMAYAAPLNDDDEFENYYAPCSFVDWIAVCHEKCQVDKLRWFLKDIESYCKEELGGQPMSNYLETEIVKNFLLEDADVDRLEIAMQVSDSWPQVRDHVCGEFLNHLCTRINQEMKNPELPNEYGAVHIEPIHDGSQVVGITLSQLSWDDPGCEYPGISICLEHETSPYKCWFFGVYLPNWIRENNQNDQLRNNLVDQLNEGSKPHNKYPWWRKIKRDYRDWNSLVPELHRETRKPGRITEYFVNEFVGIAKAAIPIINNPNT